jgi:hypothetical protein
MEQQTPHMPPSAAKMELDDEQLRVAAKINHILEATDENGQHLHSNDEVRDFMIACCFELGLPMTFELQMMMNSFLEELEIDVDEPTPEIVVNAIQAYFEANPLKPELSKAFQELGASELFKSKEGFKHDGGRVNRSLASAGYSAQKRAPRASEAGPRKAGGPKLKRGLS